MKSEQELWTRLRRHMQGHWDAPRHEDSITSWTPDVSWGARGINGWLELKVIPNRPKDPHKPHKVVPIDLRSAQRVFLKNRSEQGGPCGILVYVQKTKEYILFSNPMDFIGLGKTYTQLDWLVNCTMHMTTLVDPEVLLNFFTHQGV